MSITFDDLRTTIRNAKQGDRFALDTRALRSPAIDQIAPKVFPNQTIAVQLRPGEDISESSGVLTVPGSGVDSPFSGMGVEIRFFLADGNAAFELTATGKPGWTFAQGFPQLASSVLATCVLADSPAPQLQLRSQPGSPGQPSLPFSGTLDLERMTGGLAGLIGRKEQPLSGGFELADGGKTLAQIALTAPVAQSVDLKIATVEELSFTVGAYILPDIERKTIQASPFVGLGASIPFSVKASGGSPSQSINHHIPIKAMVADFGRDLRFSADLSDVIDAGLEELTQLTGGVGLFAGENSKPADLKLGERLTIKDLTIDVNPSATNKISAIGLELQSKVEWTIARLEGSGKEIKLSEQVDLRFRLSDPFGAKRPWVGFTGEAAIGSSGRLVLNAFYPGFSVHGQLKEGTSLKIDELLKELSGDAIAIPSLAITELSFHLAAGDYRIAAEIEGNWPVGSLPLVIDGLGFSWASQGRQANVHGLLQIARTSLALSASYTDPALGWQFEGQTGGDPIPIGSLIDDLAHAFGQVELPAALTGLTIDTIHTTFDSLGKQFSFSCGVKIPIGEPENGKPANTVAITVLISLTKETQGSYSKRFSGHIEVPVGKLAAPLIFDLSFLSTPSFSVIVGTYAHTTGAQELRISDLVQALAPQQTPIDIPGDLAISLRDIIFVYLKGTTSPGRFLRGLDLGATIDLSQLPLVGREFPAGQTVGVEDLQVIVASQSFSADEVTTINGLLPAGVTPLPSGPAGEMPQTALPQGLTFGAKLLLGAQPYPLMLPAPAGQAPAPASPPQTIAGQPVVAGDSAKWITIQ
jgi:hypothetical protein